MNINGHTVFEISTSSNQENSINSFVSQLEKTYNTNKELELENWSKANREDKWESRKRIETQYWTKKGEDKSIYLTHKYNPKDHFETLNDIKIKKDTKPSIFGKIKSWFKK